LDAAVDVLLRAVANLISDIKDPNPGGAEAFFRIQIPI
jgi:hypothetical protein